ncbi:MAG: DUF1294 domain-containing protein [Clostridia bacterium]|nr:DUF1294 domain-containing protein [Clostridia bacterium]
MRPWLWLAGYLLAINIAALILFAVDKTRARQHGRRIPERTLLLMAVLGGSAGALAGSRLYRHKTKKPKFRIGLPLLLLLQLLIFFLLLEWRII